MPGAPTIHPEAADWLVRAQANGGAVSWNTLMAVSRFCYTIASQGLRDRFYRLNLMCGTNLEAVLVPLYRGPQVGGPTFGNATDTNSNFTSADYVESDGLKGSTSAVTNKYLATGLPMTFLGTNLLHLYASFVPDPAGSFTHLVSSRGNTTLSVAMESVFNGIVNRPRVAMFGNGQQPPGSLQPLVARTQLLCQIVSGTTIQNFGRNTDLGLLTTLSYTAANTTPFYVFACEVPGTPPTISGHCPHRIDSYSIGASFPTPAARTAFHDAMAAFRESMGRR